MQKYTAFISDLHLQESAQRTNLLFDMFIEYMPEKLEKLFILGDLFEYWIGDDDKSPYHQKIINQLASLSQAGVELYFLPGNRDFLIGKKFLKQIGAKLLPDPCPLRIYNRSMVLMHGDLLCTDDKAYLKFRKLVHNKFIQWLFLRIPLFLRRKIAKKLRCASQDSMKGKPTEWLDVTQDAVEEVFQVFTREYLIHGHTHNPDTHTISSSQRRIVLGAWHQTGSMVICNDDTKPILVEFNNANGLMNS